MNYFNLFLVLFFLYWLIVILLDRRGTLGRYNITAYGPVLMIRTQKGQELLDRLATHKKFWRVFAGIGLPAMLIGMLIMFLLILIVDYSVIVSFQTHTVPPPGKFNEPRNIFLIPGLNEYIPLWYGIIALIVTLIVHEFSHAILCKVEGIKVKSMGILLALFPIGGFAEPDEEQLLGIKEESVKGTEAGQAEPKNVATRSQRVRVLASGVMANFATALIAFILFFLFLGSISPVGEVMVTSVVPGHPADLAGIKPDTIITGINDRQVNSGQDFLTYARSLEPGSTVKLNLTEKGVRKEIKLVTVQDNRTRPGVRIYNIIQGSPAEASGIKPDMVLIRIDDTEIGGLDDFISFMNSTVHGQKINLTVLSNSSANASTLVFRDIVLARYPYNKDATKGFLGISYSPEEGAVSYSTGIGIGQFPAKDFLNILKNIPSLLTGHYGWTLLKQEGISASTVKNFMSAMLSGWLFLFSLPIYGLTGEGFPGFTGLLTNFYEPTGWAASLGGGVFILLNILMWIGWMNFYVGLFNCLPAVPLDGGHVFRDVMTSTLSRIMGDGEKVERISNAVVILFAVMILISLVFVWIAPYAVYGF